VKLDLRPYALEDYACNFLNSYAMLHDSFDSLDLLFDFNTFADDFCWQLRETDVFKTKIDRIVPDKFNEDIYAIIENAINLAGDRAMAKAASEGRLSGNGMVDMDFDRSLVKATLQDIFASLCNTPCKAKAYIVLARVHNPKFNDFMQKYINKRETTWHAPATNAEMITQIISLIQQSFPDSDKHDNLLTQISNLLGVDK